jgi:putative transposase
MPSSALKVPGEAFPMPPDEPDRLRVRLIDRVLHLPPGRLVEAEQMLARLSDTPPAPQADPAPSPPAVRDWPHAPLHRLSEEGTYFVTAGTYQKEHFFRGAERLDCLEASLLSKAKEAGWQLEAWVVFSNHYHFVGHAPPGGGDLRGFLGRLHGSTATRVNEMDAVLKRQVWHNFWDTRLTYERSYLARLNYVHQNPVKHGLVPVASQYRWCSAGWFERTATRAQVQVVYRFKTDRVNAPDDYDPV